jgi:hypothetical protein
MYDKNVPPQTTTRKHSTGQNYVNRTHTTYRSMQFPVTFLFYLSDISCKTYFHARFLCLRSQWLSGQRAWLHGARSVFDSPAVLSLSVFSKPKQLSNARSLPLYGWRWLLHRSRGWMDDATPRWATGCKAFTFPAECVRNAYLLHITRWVWQSDTPGIWLCVHRRLVISFKM